MGNKLTPRKYTLAPNTLTRIDSGPKRVQLLVKNLSGADVGLTSDSTENSISDCYPVENDGEFVDVSIGPLYAISLAGGVIWVWETEL